MVSSRVPRSIALGALGRVRELERVAVAAGGAANGHVRPLVAVEAERAVRAARRGCVRRVLARGAEWARRLRVLIVVRARRARERDRCARARVVARRRLVLRRRRRALLAVVARAARPGGSERRMAHMDPFLTGCPLRRWRGGVSHASAGRTHISACRGAAAACAGVTNLPSSKPTGQARAAARADV